MIEKGLFEFLAGDAGVQGFVGNRIYGVLLPKNYVLPAVVYSIVANIPVESLDGDNPTKAMRFQFDCYAKDYYTSRKLSNAVRSLLVPKSDHSGTTITVSYSLPDGTLIQSAQCHMDHDMPFEAGEGGYIYRGLLDIEFYFEPS